MPAVGEELLTGAREELRFRRAGTQRHNPHPGSLALLPECLGERQHERIGGTVDRHAGGRLKAGSGRDVDDNTVSCRGHRWQKMRREIDQSAAIQRDLPGVGGGILADELSVQTNARVVHQNVDPSSEVADLRCELRASCATLRASQRDVQQGRDSPAPAKLDSELLADSPLEPVINAVLLP
jgi:hypothetical protein